MMNGMMDPELIRIAQEQMSRMSPAELAEIQQQMMSNPELLKMASESMKNLRPEDLKHVTEQLKHAPSEQMTEIGKKMANASPEELAAMRAHADAQIAYEISMAEMLKRQGNQLHGQGKYSEALQKYLHAKKNLKGIPAAKSRALLLACSLNLMSCYLKTRKYNECVQEGSEVLSYDAKNVKALYRRGQAYKELGQIEEAVSNLSKAHEISPDDDTIAEALRDVEERLKSEGCKHTKTSGLIIEEITEEEADIVQSKNNKASTSSESSVAKFESIDNCTVQDENCSPPLVTNSEYFHTLENDPDAMRSFQNFVSSADPDTLAKMGGSNSGEIPPEMLMTASNLISRMSPEELQNMMSMASSFQGENPLLGRGADLGAGSVPPNFTPEMMKMASEMMNKMSREEFQRMFEMASSLKERNSFSTATPSTSTGVSSNSSSRISEAQENIASERNHTNENQSSDISFSNMRNNTSQSSFTMPTGDLQDQMRSQMKDPAMRQMFISVMKNMSPDMMASMSEQFGVKLSKEDAAKAQQAMANLSPEDLERMMKWADRVQRGVEGVKKTKSWLLGKPGMILAICMLILAIILHRLGIIGG